MAAECALRGPNAIVVIFAPLHWSAYNTKSHKGLPVTASHASRSFLFGLSVDQVRHMTSGMGRGAVLIGSPKARVPSVTVWGERRPGVGFRNGVKRRQHAPSTTVRISHVRLDPPVPRRGGGCFAATRLTICLSDCGVHCLICNW